MKGYPIFKFLGCMPSGFISIKLKESLKHTFSIFLLFHINNNEKRQKIVEKKKKSLKTAKITAKKMYFNQLSGAHSTQKLVKIVNTQHLGAFQVGCCMVLGFQKIWLPRRTTMAQCGHPSCLPLAMAMLTGLFLL